jgi:HAD superfamily hydrolase (TIGR01459 family)
VVKISNLSQIKNKYDYYLIDLVGVVYDGKDSFDGAVEEINQLIEENKTVIFLSNVPRPGSLSIVKLIEMGIKQPFHVVTSGDLARDYLAKNFSEKPLFHLGKERNTDISEGLNLNLIDTLEDADAVLLTLFIEQSQNPADYDELLLKIAQSKKEVICANPDKLAIYGNTLRTCAGYFAEEIKKHNGNVKIFGKPFVEVYERIEAFLPELKINKSKALMIGDTLETDILGAVNYGIDSLLVLSGITHLKMKEAGVSLESYKQQQGITYSPTFTMERL